MLKYLQNEGCPCGRIHSAAVDELVIGKGASDRICEFVRKYGAKKPFLLADCNTFAAGGERVCKALNNECIPYEIYVYPQQNHEPDEQTVGAAVMHFDTDCDIIIGIGSGVINDIGKILSNLSGRKYIIVATAPSMDGLGDMLAKYVAIAEWRIARIITGEYYCEQVAELIRSALKNCVENAQGLLKREQKAVEAVFEGLVISGLAMAYAGVSRPASVLLSCLGYAGHGIRYAC